MRVKVDPRLIIDFAVIAEEGSFTRASHRLGVAQPWLSARLGKLEDVLGFRLLDRTTRSVSLTHRGKEFLDVARDMMRVSAAADRLALQLGRSSRTILRVGAAPYTKVIHSRHDLLDNFAAARPDISIELETGWSISLLGKLENGEIDFSFMMGEVDQARFDTIVLAHYGIAVTVARTHPWAEASVLNVGDVARQPVQVFTRNLNSALWDALYAPLVTAGATFIEMPEMAEGAPDHMRSADAAAVFFDFAADQADSAHVVQIPIASQVAIPFQLLRHASQASHAFWEMAQSHARGP